MHYYPFLFHYQISDYEDLWTNDNSNIIKPRTNLNHLASPDLLQHTQNIVSLNNNILSPAESQSGSQHSHCSTPIVNNNLNIISPTSVHSPHLCDAPKTPTLQDVLNNDPPPKQGSPFYAEPADSLAAVAAAPRRLLGRNLVPIQQRHSNPPALQLHSGLNPTLDRIEPSEFNGMKKQQYISHFSAIYD